MTNDDLFPTLVGMVGKAATQRFLTLAQSELQRSQQALLHHLQQQDWQAAAALAHKLSATVPLYDEATLQDAIATIRANNITALQHPSFIPALTAAFQSIHANIQRFLSENNC